MGALRTLPFCPSSPRGSIIHGCVSRMSPLQRSSIKYLPQIISSSRGALPAPLGELRMQESLMRPASVAALPPRSLTIHHPGDGSHKSAAVNVACTGGRVPELKHFLWICARIRVCLLRRSRSRNFDPRVEAVNEGVQQEVGLFLAETAPTFTKSKVSGCFSCVIDPEES